MDYMCKSQHDPVIYIAPLEKQVYKELYRAADPEDGHTGDVKSKKEKHNRLNAIN